ncbi:LOW QUALITY PROTEIN: hypothetical protein CFOL_v3_36251, partial [Cephalotus follicularis]
WSTVTNHCHSLIGRIWVIWNPGVVQFTVIDISSQAIHGTLTFDKTVVFVEHSGNRLVSSKAMEEFEHCIRKCEIEDLRQTGQFFTWNNKRTGAEAIAKKIDRALGNWWWFKEFSDIQAEFLPPGISDHSPCFLPLQRPSIRGGRPFKYLNVWASHQSFLGLVRDVQRQLEGSPMEVVGKKLRLLKPLLKELHNRSFKDPSTVCTNLMKELCAQQAALDVDPSNVEARNREQQILEDYHKASRVEEAFLKQKARVQWLKLGDSNSAYFHRVVKVRQARNTIDRILKEDGQWTQNQEEVANECVRYYSNILQEPDRMGRYNFKRFGEGITEAQKQSMGRDVTDKEIEDALWSQNLDKAPGPDGYSGRFFKDAWSVVGKDVILAIKSFFVSERLPRSYNATILCLIPKSNSPSELKDFRPIACCNFLYKTIS